MALASCSSSLLRNGWRSKRAALRADDTPASALVKGNMTTTAPAIPAPDAPAHVVLLQGLPASGKSTWARDVISAHPAGVVARINNDELSQMMFGAPWRTGPESARVLEKARLFLLRSMLATPTIRLILIDNTNLSVRTVRQLAVEAHLAGATVSLNDSFLAVPIEECLMRDQRRAQPVGEAVIRRMAQQLRSAAGARKVIAELTTPPQHITDPSLPETVIVDVDGTLALMSDREPYEWHRVGEDAVNPPVVKHVQDLLSAGQHVTVMSGRDAACRAQTQAWLDQHVAPGLPLLMRAKGDTRPDFIVKQEMFNEHIAGRFRVAYVLDDRDSVVRTWRAMGLTCWQVAPGDF